MDLTNWVGTIAAILTTIAYFPQLYKVFRDRDTKAISLIMYCVLATGIFCWCLFGVLLGSWPVILANGITLCFVVTILVMKIKHG